MTGNWDDNHPVIRWANFASGSLKEIDDLELMTLRMHISVDGLLRYLLSARLGISEDSIEDEMRTASLIELALGGAGEDHLLGALRALNTARNSMVHYKRRPIDAQKQAQKHLETFFRAAGNMENKNVPWPTSLAEQLQALRDAFHVASNAIIVLGMKAGKQAERVKALTGSLFDTTD